MNVQTYAALMTLAPLVPVLVAMLYMSCVDRHSPQDDEE